MAVSGILQHLLISIHALREEGDLPRSLKPVLFVEFLSTPSARRATVLSVSSRTGGQYFYPRPPRGGRPSATAHHGKQRFISIHALREEGDSSLR